MNEKHVFINCPFDNEYFPLLKSLLFTLVYLDMAPQIAETSDSGEIRVQKVSKMMVNAPYSIHDLSRMEPLNAGDLPRFNMPFECGIDFGLRIGVKDLFPRKKLLILEKEPYRYYKVISDIAGNDIRSHGNNPEKLIKAVRDWFQVIQKGLPGYREIWLAFNEFNAGYEEYLRKNGYNPHDIQELTFSDIIDFMKAWISTYKNGQKPG